MDWGDAHLSLATQTNCTLVPRALNHYKGYQTCFYGCLKIAKAAALFIVEDTKSSINLVHFIAIIKPL